MPQVIISPAKQMCIDADAHAARGISPHPEQTARLIHALKQMLREQGPQALQQLWRVSDALLAENLERLDALEPLLDAAQLGDPVYARRVGPALFSYVGAQYRSMAPNVLDERALAWLQEHLWILSGLYGCVRPFDAVAPYRLEMGAKLAVDGGRNLYEFWGSALAQSVEAAGEEIVNLASVEYARAVLPHLDPHTRVTTCIFGEELRAGKPMQRAGASKVARGSMVRWLAERACTDARNLTTFDVGYAFAPELSDETEDGARTLVFMRR